MSRETLQAIVSAHWMYHHTSSISPVMISRIEAINVAEWT
jgi:hypothetical protein